MAVVRLYSRQPSLIREFQRSVEKPFGVALEINRSVPPFDASFVLSTARSTRAVEVMAQRLGAEVAVLPEAAFYLYLEARSAGGVVVAVGADHVRTESLQPPLDGGLF